MRIIKHILSVLRAAFTVEDWLKRGKTTAYEAFLVLGVSALIFGSLYSSGDGFYGLAVKSVFISSFLVMMVRIVALPYKEHTNESNPNIYSDKDIQARSVSHIHEFAMVATSAFILILLIGVIWAVTYITKEIIDLAAWLGWG